MSRAIAFAVLGAVACVRAEPLVPALEPSCEPTAVRAAWRADTVGEFTVDVPPGFTAPVFAGIDSDVRIWRRGAAQLSSDYGPYSGAYTRDPGDRDVRECAVVIDRDAVSLTLYRDSEGAYNFMAWWPRVAPVRMPSGQRPASLNVYGKAGSEIERRELLRTLYSLRLTRSH